MYGNQKEEMQFLNSRFMAVVTGIQFVVFFGKKPRNFFE